MASRYALLIGSNVQMLSAHDRIEPHVVSNNLDAIERILLSLGDYAFAWKDSRKSKPRRLVNPKRADLVAALAEPTNVRRDDTLLIYYSGHAIRSANEGLIVAYKDYNEERPQEQFELQQILREAKNQNFSRIILILDCCHSGMNAKTLAAAENISHLCVLSGADDEYAFIGESGFFFTLALHEAFTRRHEHDAARDVSRNAVTPGSWFKCTEEIIKDKKFPVDAAFSSEGDIVDEILVPLDQNYRNAIDYRAPINTYYRKFFEILNIVKSGRNAGVNFSHIYEAIGNREDGMFDVSIRKGDAIITRRISAKTVMSYLKTLVDLGLIERRSTAEPLWRLTPGGRQAIHNSGSRYNSILRDQVFDVYLRSVPREPLRKTVIDLCKSLKKPTSETIYLTLRAENPSLPLSLHRLAQGLHLLSFSGFLDRATSDTYFVR